VKGRPLKPRTVAQYHAMLDDHILPTFGSKPVRDITMESVDRWYARTLKDKPTMRAHTYSLLRTILETARTRDRIIETNPCLIRGAGTATRKIKPKPATLDQLAVLAAEMPDRYRLMVDLAAWCALRFGELVELRRADVDLADSVVKIRRAAVRVDGGWVVGDPKSDAGARDVAIPPHIVPAVTESPGDACRQGVRLADVPGQVGRTPTAVDAVPAFLQGVRRRQGARPAVARSAAQRRRAGRADRGNAGRTDGARRAFDTRGGDEVSARRPGPRQADCGAAVEAC
jgi:integrase